MLRFAGTLVLVTIPTVLSADTSIDFSQYNHVPRNVVLISSDEGYGLGVVIAKNLVLTTTHVVYSEIPKPMIQIMFYPNFRKAFGNLLKATDRNVRRELALIETDTGNITPARLAEKIPIGEKVYWYSPGEHDHPNLIKNGGKTLRKSDRVNMGLSLRPYEPDAPQGQEIVVTASGDAPPASSGGPVFNKRNKLVGIIFGPEGPHESNFISVDGIRRFLAEYASESAK